MNIFHVWIFFICEYFSGVNISQFKFRIRTDYFGLVLKDIYGRRNEKFEEYLSTNESLFCIFKFLNLLIFFIFLYFKPESRPTISVRRRAGICANNSWKWKEFTKDWEKKKMSRRDDEKWTRFRAPGASSLQTWRLNLEEHWTKNDF